MAFVDANCAAIAAKAAKGALTQAEIMDAFARIDERDRRLKAEGAVNRGERIRQWAAGEGERTKIAAAVMRRHAVLNVLTRDRLDRQIKGMIDGGLAPHRALRATLEGINSPTPGSRESAWAAQAGYRDRYVGALFADLEREKPHMVHNLNDSKLDSDVLVEMWETRKGGNPGSTKNPDAVWLAKRFAAYGELSRTEANRLGASIGKLDGWAGVQTHDPIKMLKGDDESWSGFTLALLDDERTFPEGGSTREKLDILNDVYQTLITGLPNKPTAAEIGQRVNPANLAKSLGKSRVLHFKDGKAALTYRDQFGYGNTISGMFEHLQHMAKVNGAMEKFGPNPDVMFRSIGEGLKRAIKESTSIPDAMKKPMMDKLNTEAGALRHAVDVLTGLVSRPVNVTVAKIASDIRVLQGMGKLGLVLPSSLGDTVTAAIAAQFRGSGFLNGLTKQLGGVLRGRPRREQGEIAYFYGEGFEGMLGHILSNGYAEDRPLGALGKWQDKFFKWSGLTWWTDVNRAVAARVIGAELGMHAGTAFDRLPPAFRHVLSQSGIDAETWRVLGTAALRMDNGKPYLTPDRVREIDPMQIASLIPDRIAAINASKIGADVKAERIALAISDETRRLEVRMLSYVADQTSYAVIAPDARTRRYATGLFGQGKSDAGTLGGEVLRLIMQFKSYPLGFTTRTFGRALFGHRKDATFIDKAVHMGTLIAGLTIAGYISTVAKDTLKGYWPPRNPADPRTIFAALQQGGGLGIYGDYLFSKVNRFGGSLQETLAGPTLGTAGQVWDIWNAARDAGVDAVTGQDPKFPWANTFNQFVGMVPFANLHLVKPVLDYLILNSIRDALSPGVIQKQRRTRMTEYGQDYSPAKLLGPTSLDPLNIARTF